MKAEVGKRYRHYKNKKEYIVLAVGFYTEKEPLEPCVVYQAQYSDGELGDQPVFIRPQEMFEKAIDVDGKMMDRFEQIG